MATEGVHRLNNMVVEEVSLVDRAANKRKFLVVKRDETMGRALQPDGRGGFRMTKAADADEDTDEEKAAKAKAKEDAEKAAGKKPPPFPPPPAEKVADPEEDEDEEKAAKILVAAGLEKFVSRIKADPQGMALAKQVGQIASDLADVAEKLASEEEDEPSDVHMKKIVAAHKSMGAICQKYTKRVGKSLPRETQFKAAMSNVTSILNDLIETTGSAGEHKPAAGDPTMPASGWSAKNPSDAPTNAMGEAAIKALNDTVAELKNQLAAQGAELAKVSKGIPGSTSNSAGERPRRPVAATAWPRDMADDRTIDPNTSFG
jgi:uncharacterized coiled-coil protein SlyX